MQPQAGGWIRITQGEENKRSSSREKKRGEARDHNATPRSIYPRLLKSRGTLIWDGSGERWPDLKEWPENRVGADRWRTETPIKRGFTAFEREMVKVLTKGAETFPCQLEHAGTSGGMTLDETARRSVSQARSTSAQPKVKVDEVTVARNERERGGLYSGCVFRGVVAGAKTVRHVR